MIRLKWNTITQHQKDKKMSAPVHIPEKEFGEGQKQVEALGP